MNTERQNGYPAAEPVTPLFAKGEAKPPELPVLEYHPPPMLLPVEKDLRERSSPDYRNKFDNLVADIRERGVQVPIIGYRENGRIPVLDGETRRQAALMAGVETVPVLVLPKKPTEAEMKLAQVQVNAMRIDMGTLELAAVYQDLMGLNGWTQAELAKRLHVAPGQVTKILAISAKCCPCVRELVASGELAPRAAYALSRLADHAKQAALAEKAIKADEQGERIYSVEDVEGWVTDELLGGRKKAEKPLAIKGGGITLMVKDPTLEKLLAWAEALAAAVKRVIKDGDPLAILPSRMKSA